MLNGYLIEILVAKIFMFVLKVPLCHCYVFPDGGGYDF
jgi:hypothetical protein